MRELNLGVANGNMHFLNGKFYFIPTYKNRKVGDTFLYTREDGLRGDDERYEAVKHLLEAGNKFTNEKVDVVTVALFRGKVMGYNETVEVDNYVVTVIAKGVKYEDAVAIYNE